jgi:hypothetical protein
MVQTAGGEGTCVVRGTVAGAGEGRVVVGVAGCGVGSPWGSAMWGRRSPAKPEPEAR